MQPRWRKVVADFFSNKTRTALVVLSIAVGVFAVGFVTSSFIILLKDMDIEYKGANPSEATIYSDSFQDELLDSLRQIPGVSMVKGTTSIFARTEVEVGKKAVFFISAIPRISANKWASYDQEQKDAALKAISDLDIDRLRPEDPPILPTLKEHEVFLERTTASALKMKTGDDISVELESGRIRILRVAGIIYDITSPPYIFTNWLSGYVNPDTMTWLESSRDFNAVKLRVSENNTDEAHVKEIAGDVADKIEKSGREVYFTFVLKPGRHWGSDITQSLLLVMGILGFLSVLLSGFLVLNTVTALLSQHIRQIGIMKAIGARSIQVMGMYFILVTSFGLMALLLTGLPGLLAGYYVAKFIAGFLNFNVAPFHAPIEAVTLEIIVAIGTPLFAAVIPVINGTRVSIREAITNYGLGQGKFGKSILDRILESIRFVSRPLIISLRNTFRRKGRLTLTLITLTLGGATFIAVFNTQAAIANAIQETMGYYLSDVNVSFSHTYRIQLLEKIVFKIQGVKQVEGWGSASSQLLSLDEKNSNTVDILAPPGNAKLIRPVVVKGRWLTPMDENAIVIGNALLKIRPDLKVGDEVILKINKRKYKFNIVGVFRMAGMTINPFVYANYDYISNIIHQPDQYSNIRLVTSPQDTATQERVRLALEKEFLKEGISVQEISTRTQQESSNQASVNVIILFLLVMALLIACVGGLGLMGTMSMNVLERTREIGVMRATGASDSSILGIVITEGIIIGMISWIFGAILAFPISVGLNNALGDSLMSSTLAYRTNVMGYMLWLAIALGISALASAIPARNASRLTIREILAYE